MNHLSLSGHKSRRRHTPNSGLTLLELLVCIFIIGLLLALLLPAIQAARRAAANTQCKSRLRQIGLALHSYEAIHRQFPPHYTGSPGGWVRPVIETSLGSWPFDDTHPLQSPINLLRAHQTPRPDLLKCALSLAPPVTVYAVPDGTAVTPAEVVLPPNHGMINTKVLGRPIGSESSHTFLIDHTSQAEHAWPFPIATDAPSLDDPKHRPLVLLFEDGHVSGGGDASTNP